jgi:catechol 2,3-dioxygenase-like lactoylglutathione lyase family enzyme
MNYGQDLSYIALVVDDVDAARRMWSGPFGLTASELELPGREAPVPLMEVGESALALFATGDPLVGGQQHTGVHHVALGVPDVGDAIEQAREAGVAGEDGAAEPDAAGRFTLSRQATGGVRTLLVERRERAGFEPGFVRRVDHIGIMGTDNRQARDVYCDRLGCALTGEQVDTEIRTSTEHFVYTSKGMVNTVVYNRPAEFVASVHDLFIRVGDCDLEIIESLDPHDKADAGPSLPGTGTLKLDHSAVTGFIAKRGPGLHHVAFRVDDIDASLAHLAGEGFDLIDRQGRPGARGSRIGFVRLRSTQGVLVHLVERDDRLEGGTPRSVLEGATTAA